MAALQAECSTRSRAVALGNEQATRLESQLQQVEGMYQQCEQEKQSLLQSLAETKQVSKFLYSAV